MADIIKADYQMLEEMARTFRSGAQQLEDTLRELQNIANTFENGALLGRGGQSFSEVIRGPMCASVEKMIAKFQELEYDVLGAMTDHRDEDIESGTRF
ncbi:MAG TPA: WXG100 family type VII secretion target [Anaerolineaceae bacterium]|nr:WXG100 family type VII secretion target [Anaerolineaceae bacterium]HPN51111.1 WXG100 family type VII secretion target [Anaerolineaceae bacterium]